MRRVVVMVAAALLAGGCAHDVGQSGVMPTQVPQSEGEEAITSSTTGVVKNLELWTLPTDPYYDAHRSDVTGAAEAVVRVRCMKEAGYDYSEDISLEQAHQDTSSPGGTRIFNERLAQKYGYRLAPLGDSGSDHAPETQSERFQDDYERCVTQGQDEVRGSDYIEKMFAQYGKPPELPGENGTEADWDAYFQKVDEMNAQNPLVLLNRLHVDPASEVLAAQVKEWRSCMQPLGIPDLPDVPFEIDRGSLPESLQTKWNWEPTGTASADEILVAVHDARCRRSSGWDQALYDEEWRIREEFLAQYAQALAPMLDTEQEIFERAQAILKEHGIK